MRKLILAGVAGIALGSVAAQSVFPLAWSQFPPTPPPVGLPVLPPVGGAPPPAPQAPPSMHGTAGQSAEEMRGHMHGPRPASVAAPASATAPGSVAAPGGLRQACCKTHQFITAPA